LLKKLPQFGLKQMIYWSLTFDFDQFEAVFLTSCVVVESLQAMQAS
jgi:hypothetical protein